MKYIILSDDGNPVSRERFPCNVIPSHISAFDTSEEEINEARMEKSKVLELKDKMGQYGWNYRVFEFYEKRLHNMKILSKFE
ncbi:MAG: hypothetical protein WA061_02840 [Microgenomates group bacterium]